MQEHQSTSPIHKVLYAASAFTIVLLIFAFFLSAQSGYSDNFEETIYLTTQESLLEPNVLSVTDEKTPAATPLYNELE